MTDIERAYWRGVEDALEMACRELDAVRHRGHQFDLADIRAVRGLLVGPVPEPAAGESGSGSPR